ncbi:rhodanese-like domain-containing protein [Portibacter marinus]|uniref:rhodanese-like domain-containing protein n=1 Tax=Portibacter marinus TaxID=2898660 RepID=UPI001F2CCA04|nr:rhodanese-like domain-containing protein [Portibacter marinus]
MLEKNKEPEICEVPRWQMIKATLNNLDYKAFIDAAKKDEHSVIIDVRTQAEHELDHIPGSKVMDYLDRDLASKMETLDKDKSYYIYCRTGRRSLRVCVILKNLGFESVYNLEDGIVSRPQT